MRCTRQEGVCHDGKTIGRSYCRERDYISVGGEWLLLSAVKFGTGNGLCDWKVRYHAWGVYDEVPET